MTLAAIWGGAFGWIFLILSWLLALGWLWRVAEWLLHSGEVPDLTRISNDVLPSLPALHGPQLTVIVPACNEETAIGATLRSLLASEGIRLQIVAVNDRSTDRTGEIMERVAGEYSDNDHSDNAHSIQVISIRELPAGWLGKSHALSVAAELATADWILFTDGDVLFAPEAGALALRYAMREQVDHVVLMPDWTMKTHGEAAMHGALHALSTWTLRLWRVADPKTRDFLGVGAFNLARREVYESLGGFAALRMEVLEDLRFGWMLKGAGYRQRVVLGPGLAAVRWSEGAWGVVRNLEKNLFALYRYRVLVALLACGGLAVQIVWPIAAIVFGISIKGSIGSWVLAAGITIYAAIALLYAASRQVTRVRPWYVLAFPLAAGLFLFAMVRSMVLAWVRGGVKWRGTLYSLRDLRANAGKFWS